MTIDQAIYENRFGEEDIGQRQELWRVLCENWMRKYFPEDARTLDLGAGGCEFINAIQCRQKLAIDHNPDMLKYAAPEVECFVAEFDEGLAKLEAGCVDRVMASNVFEHLLSRESLFTCLEGVHRVLAQDGKIVIMQPNISAVKERFYDFSDHSLPLTEKGMQEAVEACGFRVEKVMARFLPYTTKSRYPKWPILVRMYLRFPPAHWLLGGQMFIVARKIERSPEG